MARQAAHPETGRATARFTDAFVIFAVTVVSLALGAWFLLHLGLALWSGLVLALAIYTVLLAVHLMLRRSIAETETSTADELLDDEAWSTSVRIAAAMPRDAAMAGAPASEQADPLPYSRADDPFNFRPAQPPTLDGTIAEAVRATFGKADARAAAAAPQPEMSVELIQDLIKKLADELNTGPTPGASAAKPEPANETEAMIGRSIAALEAATKSMRAPVADIGAHAIAGGAANPELTPPTWWPTQPPAPNHGQAPPPSMPPVAPPPLNPHVARIAEALAAERMEVMLEPIHALAEGRARHFEVSLRLLTADGATLEPADYARLAQGSGLMPQIDCVRLVRAARVAKKLGDRGRQGSVLTAVTVDSLADAGFVDTAVAEPADGAMRLVLSFTQNEVRAFSPGHVQALAAMAAAGFSYAIDQVADLDMDFGALKAMGFEFVKLDAPVFLEGLSAPGGHVPAADICRTLAEFGLTLIVGRIEDDWLLARILGFGVLFGKGTLFGGPRLVKPEIVAGAAAA